MEHAAGPGEHALREPAAEREAWRACVRAAVYFDGAAVLLSWPDRELVNGRPFAATSLGTTGCVSSEGETGLE